MRFARAQCCIAHCGAAPTACCCCSYAMHSCGSGVRRLSNRSSDGVTARHTRGDGRWIGSSSRRLLDHITCLCSVCLFVVANREDRTQDGRASARCLTALLSFGLIGRTDNWRSRVRFQQYLRFRILSCCSSAAAAAASAASRRWRGRESTCRSTPRLLSHGSQLCGGRAG